METIDKLPVQSDFNSKSPLTLSPFNFRLLLAAIGVERCAYYGLRSVIVFYAIGEFGVTDQTAFSQYSYLILIVYASQFLGGFLGDFLLGARNGLLVGLGLSVTGILLVTIQDSYMFYLGIFIIAVGSGFFRSNTFSLISHFTAHDKVLLEKRFISMYALINLGAFLSSVFMAVIGNKYGYIYSFIIVLALYALGMALIFVMSNKTNTYSTVQSEVKKGPKPITKGLLIIILITISSALFWILFEKYSITLVGNKLAFFDEHSSEFIRKYMWSIPVVFLLLLSIPYYFLAKHISTFTKLAISMLLIGICWIASGLFLEGSVLPFGFGALILFMVMEGIADIFLTPSVLTLLAIHTSKKYYGVIFALYSVSIYGASRAFSYVESSYFKVLVQIGIIVLLIASIVLFFILPFIAKDKDESNPSLEE